MCPRDEQTVILEDSSPSASPTSVMATSNMMMMKDMVRTKGRVRVLCNSTMLEQRRKLLLPEMSIEQPTIPTTPTQKCFEASIPIVMDDAKSIESSQSTEKQPQSTKPFQYTASAVSLASTKSAASTDCSVTSDSSSNSDSAVSTVQDDGVWSTVGKYISEYNLTDDETYKLMDLKDRLQDLQHHPKHHPLWFVRYLMTQAWDMEKAEAQIRTLIQWRIDNHVDTMLQDYTPPPELMAKYPGAILKGADKVGDPIFISRLGVTDLTGLLDRFGADELLKYEIYRREAVFDGAWVKDWEQRSGRTIQQSMVVEDLSGLSRKSLTSKAVKFYGMVAEMDNAYYFESNKKIIIIRVPTIFRFAWALVKRFFDAKVVDKMVFCGDNYLSTLEEYMDIDVLPPCINPDGHGEAVEGLPPCFDGGVVN